ncbi:MAG: Rrf2 family transcriptional regulator [Sulfurospirillaceae bacterium]|nr:Rrf2 family transcriptional regulator [Sulfurospirillaceae bacterium]
MALISTKGMYGLSAMYALSNIESDKPTQIKDISEKAEVPQNYLEQLLVTLKRANLITSVRGAHGGYFLARNADDILIKDILVALEGNLSIVESDIQNPVLKLFYDESNKKLDDIFNIPLSKLQEYEELLRGQIHYII